MASRFQNHSGAFPSCSFETMAFEIVTLSGVVVGVSFVVGLESK